MTIPEACSLVLETGGVGQNGSTYLLDMGEPIKICDFAEQVIRFSGYEPYKDVDIKFIGLRKGERLDEPLWLDCEEPTPTEYPKILQLKNCSLDYDLQQLLKKLEPICFFDSKQSDLYRSNYHLIQILSEISSSIKEFYNGESK